MKKIKNVIVIIVMLICLIGIIYSGYHIIKWKKIVNSNAKIKDNINSLVVKRKNGSYRIDFDKLIKINDDTVAYIKVPGTDINYVVVKSSNNSYYLDHNYEKQNNLAGWIFADYRNNFDDKDKNIIIYGHNMKDQSMFGTLRNVLDENWYKKNYKIELITQYKTYIYEVFSSYMIKSEEYYLSNSFNFNDEFSEFIKVIKNRSIYSYKTDINSSDRILTLSTCNDDGSKRIVVHAKLIKENNN